MFRKKLLLLLAVTVLLALVTVSAAADDGFTEVENSTQFFLALWKPTTDLHGEPNDAGDFPYSVQEPVNIRLTADFSVNYTQNCYAYGAPFTSDSNRQNAFVAPGSVIDLNGHTLTISNVKFFYALGTEKCADQTAPLFVNGHVILYYGNNTNTMWGLGATDGILGGTVCIFRTSSRDTFKSEKQKSYAVPAGIAVEITMDPAVSGIAKTLTLATGCTLSGGADFHAGNAKSRVVLEAACADDLLPERYGQMRVDEIVLTADIEAPSLALVLPAETTLNYNGHRLTCASVSGKTADTSYTSPVPAPAEKPAEGTTVTVQEGDNLYSLARTYLGDGAKWSVLYAANRALLGANPLRLLPGTVLTLPK